MAKAGGMAVDSLKDGMLYHDIELAATKGMKDDAKKSIGFFSMPQSAEYSQYTQDDAVNVDEIVRQVLKNMNK